MSENGKDNTPIGWNRVYNYIGDLNAMHKQGEGRVDAAIQVWDMIDLLYVI